MPGYPSLVGGRPAKPVARWASRVQIPHPAPFLNLLPAKSRNPIIFGKILVRKKASENTVKQTSRRESLFLEKD